MTLTLAEARAMIDVKDLCVRIMLTPGEVFDLDLDCLQLQIIQPEEAEKIEVELGDFDLMALFTECMVGVPANIQAEVRTQMGRSFHGEAITLLLARTPNLTQVEALVLKALAAGAAGELYWDTLRRLEAKLPDLPIILSNIKIRATAWGLASELELLKEQCNAEETAVEDGPEDRDVSLSGAPLL